MHALQADLYHPVWGQVDNYAIGREKRKQLLIMLCQHEADRLEVWAQPMNTKYLSSLIVFILMLIQCSYGSC